METINNDEAFIKKLMNFLWVQCKNPISVKLIMDIFETDFGNENEISSGNWEEFCRKVYDNEEDLIDENVMMAMFEFVFPQCVIEIKNRKEE